MHISYARYSWSQNPDDACFKAHIWLVNVSISVAGDRVIQNKPVVYKRF